jgi:hypothetical protein
MSFQLRSDYEICGLGPPLLLALFVRLLHCRHRSTLVWVVCTNPARFLYERRGGTLVPHRLISVGGAPVEAAGALARAVRREARGGARGSSPP